jgi:hypothetical protein
VRFADRCAGDHVWQSKLQNEAENSTLLRVKVVDLEEDRVAVSLERAKIVLFMGVVGVAEVVEHGDGLDDTLDRLLAEGGDAWRHDGDATAKVLPQLVIESANALSSGIHVDSPLI